MPVTEYENVPSGLKDDIEFRVVKGTKIEIPREVAQSFYDRSRKMVKSKEKVEAESEIQKEQKDGLIKLVEAINGLRGVRSALPDDQFSLLVVSEESEEWDRDLLKASLGVLYDSLVSEELVVNLTIPVKVTDEATLKQGIIKLLTDLKVPVEDVEKVMETKVDLRIDVEKIDDLIGKGKVTLLAGTRDIDQGWKVTNKPLKEKKPVKQKEPEKAKKK